MSIWKYEDLLPSVAVKWQMSLGEGGAPLIKSRRIGPSLGMENLFFKLETVNPTGSYKDRFAAAAISFQLASGSRFCLGTSSGNTGSALAAYAAAAGVPCLLAIVDTVPEGKLRQMMAYGAKLFRIREFGIDPGLTAEIIDGLPTLAEEMQATMEVSAFVISPLGMAGVQTISYELAEQLPEGIAHVFTPSGGGGLTLAVERGFSLLRAKRDYPLPAVHCVQPEGNNTIAGPLRSGESQAKQCVSTTEVSGLQVGDVHDGHMTLEACRNSGGTGHLVSDEAVFAMQARLARDEGVFCEPAGAVSVTALQAALAEEDISPQDVVVCLITGTGFKDERSVERMTANEVCPRLDSFAAFAESIRECVQP